MAYENDVLTRNDNDELAVRTVQTTGDNPGAYDDIYTRDDNGKLCVRVTGAGGGSVDYNRVVEKIATIPTATSSTVGKVYMYMGETDSTYTHGYIYECVATQEATDVSFSGSVVSSWAVADFVSYLQEGGANYDEVTHGTLTYEASGDLWVLVGLDANNNQVMRFQEYTEDLEDFGCVFASSTHQDGENCEFTLTTTAGGAKWKRMDVQPAGSSDNHNLGWFADLTALQTAHPTGANGDFAILGSTDTVWVWDSGTSAWKDTDQKGQVASVNGQTGTVVLTASDVGAATTAQGAKADTAVQPGDLATVATSGSYDDLTDKPTIPAAQVNSDWDAVSGVAQILNKPTLGTMASESASDYTPTSDLADVATTGAYSDLSGTPTIPAPTQVSTLPTAGADELGNIYQFIGTTDANYTNGYFYKCVSDGQDPATYSWEQTDVMPAGSSLPDQTGQSGKFLTTDGTDASWSDKIQITGSSGNYGILSIGVDANVTTYGGIAIGQNTSVTGAHGVSIGSNAASNDGVSIGKNTSSASKGISIGGGSAPSGGIHIGMFGTNSTSSTMTVSLGTTGLNYRIYTLLSADGTIPTARLTKVNTTITLAAADWSSNTQTVSVTGMTADGVVMVSPDPTDQSAYTSAGILCTAQAAGTLTFTCSTTPSADLSVNVVML